MGIAVGASPNNMEYFTGEDIDLSGLIVNGTWEGNRQRTVQVTLANLSSFDKNRAGKQDVFITYQGKTASFPVTFVGMQSVSISRPPEKLNYANGENLDLNGLAVQGTRLGATSIELVDVSRVKLSGYDRFKAGNQTVTVMIGGRSATFRVTVGPNPFEGTWSGTKVDSFDDTKILPIRLVISEDTWKVNFEKTDHYFADEYSGTYTRDNDDGKRAELLLKKYGSSKNIAPTAATIISPRELKLTGGTFGKDGITLTR